MENQEDTKMDVVESTPSEKTNSQSESTASQRKFKPPARVSRGTSKTSTTIVYFSLQSIFETFVSNPVKSNIYYYICVYLPHIVTSSCAYSLW